MFVSLFDLFMSLLVSRLEWKIYEGKSDYFITDDLFRRNDSHLGFR